MCRISLLLKLSCFLFTILALFLFSVFFFFNDTATTEIYTLSLHDALPIWRRSRCGLRGNSRPARCLLVQDKFRSEEHTSELQSRFDLVCRLLLEKKKKKKQSNVSITTRNFPTF